MGPMQGHVLRRRLPDVEERNPELGGVLARRSAADSLHTGIIGDVRAILEYFAALNLPAQAGINDVVQAISMQGIPKVWRKRQTPRSCQPTAAVGNEEVPERSTRECEPRTLIIPT